MIQYGKVVVILMDLGHCSVEQLDQLLLAVLAPVVIGIVRFAVAWLLDVLARQLAVVPVEHAHLSPVLSRH